MDADLILTVKKFQCNQFNETLRLTSNPNFECKHVQSVPYNTKKALAVVLGEDPLLTKVLKKGTIKEIKEKKNRAKACGTQLVVIAKFATDDRRIHFSVEEDDRSHTYSKMSRVCVTYDKAQNAWFCVCCSTRSCIHKYISKWACLMHHPEVFSFQDSNIDFSQHENSPEHDTFGASDEGALSEQVKRVINYQKQQKTIPVPIPEAIMVRSRCHDFPVELHPSEVAGTDCETVRRRTDHNKSLYCHKEWPCNQCQGISEKCPSRNMVYNYQDFKEGVHNFNNSLILSLELCLHFPSMITTCTAVNRVVFGIEQEYQRTIPHKQDILQKRERG